MDGTLVDPELCLVVMAVSCSTDTRWYWRCGAYLTTSEIGPNAC